MPSERTQRQIDRLLDEAEQAIAQRDWTLVQTLAQDVLALDPENREAHEFLTGAERRLGVPEAGRTAGVPNGAPGESAASRARSIPPSFVSGRYTVEKFLGEGGKKRVYLAKDTLLDRRVAFALIKTEGLDEVGRTRIKREAQSMGRLGSHPHIVSVFDMGDEQGQPYIVTELMAGGDVEGVIEKAPEHRPSLDRTLEIGIAVCRGLDFAHSQGIVHRDLKPGNVWLTADGIAKLGDFGLAVALDKSRLTQGGMMVGTVSYMPPEQAMGGEVTPRSDLYSLGAMLYEMVTGRPPFVGDESVAIITQHLNTAPVSPSWHNASIAPALEALVLRLLEKDPAKRPSSASEVREALEAILSTARHALAALHDAIAPPTPAAKNPLYGRTFVGREAELRQLQMAFDAALSGQGGLVMVVGEPGIGKTALSEQLATYAIVRGGRTLVGHCYEEGSLSLPYLPFVEAMRGYVLSREPDALKQELGSGAGEVARIVSEVRDRVQVELRPAGDPDEDRWRLLQAIGGFLRNAATVQPLIVILEDLHDADRGTLDLLVHLSHNLAGARLLLVGTYRDIEVDRAHPLSGALAELRRASSFLRVPLRGLTAEEVQRMMAGVSQQEIPWPLAELLHRQTEGNPLFVQEMLRYLVEEGLVERRGGALRRVGEETLAGRIPEGLRDVIGKRLSRLSAESNRLLSVAAVIGRDFTLTTLQSVADVDEDTLVTAMEEATRAAVLTEQARVGDVQYRFAHAFFRQTLYEELSAPRRLRFHQQIARALERQYGARLEEHAAELAEHFAQSTDGDDLTKAVAYSELAARRAMAVYAYGEAARHLEQALEVQEVLDPNDMPKRCHLLLALGEALLPAGEPKRVAETVAPAALALAEPLGDRQSASRACQQALAAVPRQSGGFGWLTPLYRQWAERADRFAAPDSVDRVSADCAMCCIAFFSGRQREAWDLAQLALTLARQLDNSQALYQAAWLFVFLTWPPEHQEKRLHIAEEFFPQQRADVSTNTMGHFLFGCCGVFLGWGKRADAEQALRQIKELVERTRDIDLSIELAGHEIAFLLLDGRIEEAAQTGQNLLLRSDDLGLGGTATAWALTPSLWPLLHLGRAEEILALLRVRFGPSGLEGRSPSLAALSALCLGRLGLWTEVHTLLDQLRERRSTTDHGFDLNISPLVHYLVAAVQAEDRELASQLRESLAPAASLIADRYPTVIARHLGAASALLGERESARRYYEQALEVAGKVRFRPEIALTHLQLAELLLEDADDAQRTEALQHLDFAISELREMKMQPALERALRHKAVLKA